MPDKWRPEGWDKNKPYIHYDDPTEEDVAFEAGADAMLEALKKDGTHFRKGRWTDDATFETKVPGTVVFIPDGKK